MNISECCKTIGCNCTTQMTERIGTLPLWIWFLFLFGTGIGVIIISQIINKISLGSKINLGTKI